MLSACETGYGKLIHGEGVMSLSRAFAYAGCPGLVMSLWEVSDQATAELMVKFYQHLKDDKDVDEALRLAKLEFLENTNHPNFAHPYLWAGFVPVGDMKSITINKMYTYWWLWLSAGIIGFIGLWLLHILS